MVRDERMERGALMSAAVVEGTDADDAKSNEMLTPRRFGGFCSRKSFSTDIFILSQRH